MVTRLLPACLLIGISILQISASPSPKENNQLSYRLPENLYPEYYKLEIITNLADYNDNFTFEGRVWIQVSIFLQKIKTLKNLTFKKKISYR